MMRCITAVLAILSIASIAAASPQQSPTDRIVEEDLRIPLPLVPCMAPAVARRVAHITRVPIGLELVPEPCGTDRKTPRDPANDVFLQGMSVGAVFDELIRLDPRYTWTEADGVLVFRPVLASNDPSHFLHQTIPSFTVVDGRMSGALHIIQTALASFPLPEADQYAFGTPEGNQRFSVSLDATSVLEALNASVRAHGSMWWEVRYCQPATRYEYASIFFYTFDGSGFGSHGAARQDGKSFDACSPRK